ncbi:DUF3325 domain-containing protein [Rhodanobacter sp. Col0626]|uniref:DUF3325 domain-containing protein n=1 Tax=Rhodanobacter sp. Col0626 TaxID=3415679 RepID=UPI003CF4CDDB
MILLSACLWACTGFTALYLAMSRHQPDALGRRLPERSNTRLRGLGGAGLAIAWLACVEAQGWARGSVAIFGVLALAATLVMLLGTWHARQLASIGVLTLIGAAACATAAWSG